jgi:hypothetical protein
MSHSKNMCEGVVKISHEKFDERFKEATKRLANVSLGENVAHNNDYDYPCKVN